MQSINEQRKQGGRQRNWDEVRAKTAKPIITIITSTYNVAQVLHWTLDSIRKQTYENVQWIVADGASTDDTVELLRQHSDVIDYWFSEPDTGIYDAWNKALEYIQGDWVQFIGAGDELFEADTLKKAAVYLRSAYPEYELVYGQVMHVSEKNRKELYVSGEPWENYKNKWDGNRPKLPVQTGIYHHSSYFTGQKTVFDTSYKIVADCHLLLQEIKLNTNMKFIPFIFTIMPIGGVSGSVEGGLKIYLETQRSMKELNIMIPIHKRFMNSIKYKFVRVFIKILSVHDYEKFIDFIKVMRGKPKIFTVE